MSPQRFRALRTTPTSGGDVFPECVAPFSHSQPLILALDASSPPAQLLKSVVVCGIREVTRAVITQKDENEKTEEREKGVPCYRLLVEGAGLQARDVSYHVMYHTT